MLCDPNDESPANVDAAVSNVMFFCTFILTTIHFLFVQKEFREDMQKFKKNVARCVRKSQEAL